MKVKIMFFLNSISPPVVKLATTCTMFMNIKIHSYYDFRDFLKILDYKFGMYNVNLSIKVAK